MDCPYTAFNAPKDSAYPWLCVTCGEPIGNHPAILDYSSPKEVKPAISYTYMSDGEQPKSETPLDKIKLAIMELAYKEQRKIYEFLYALGHRING